MPQIQIDALNAIIRNSHEIAKQLEIANKLKALELKATINITPEMVDDVMNSK